MPGAGRSGGGARRQDGARLQRGDQRALHLVSAYGSGLGVVPRQVRKANKSNEITAIPELLDALLLKGAIVTIDAMGCQQRIADKVIQSQLDYVLAVKDNQHALARQREQDRPCHTLALAH